MVIELTSSGDNIVGGETTVYQLVSVSSWLKNGVKTLHMTSTRHTPFFFKNSFYKNIEAEICEISRINPRMRGIKFEKDIILCVENVNNMLLTKTYKIIAFSQWQKVFPPPTPKKATKKPAPAIFKCSMLMTVRWMVQSWNTYLYNVYDKLFLYLL